MTPPLDVTVSGPFFSKHVSAVVKQAILKETMEKIDKRMQRRGRKLGRKRNPIGPGELTLGGGITLVITSTKNWPRTAGTSWTRKSVAIIKSMAPRVMRKALRRIVEDLN